MARRSRDGEGEDAAQEPIGSDRLVILREQLIVTQAVPRQLVHPLRRLRASSPKGRASDETGNFLVDPLI